MISVEVVGPSRLPDCGGPVKLEWTDTIWLPMEVTPESLDKLKKAGAMDDSWTSTTLLLSIRSLTLGPESRFRLVRGILEGRAGYKFSASDFKCKNGSWEFLAEYVAPTTYDPRKPPTHLKPGECGHTMRCLSLRSKVEAQIYAHHPQKSKGESMICTFDPLSRAMA